MPTMSSYFYPRPPQGGRQPVNVLAEQGVQFLSTPSARRATVFGVRLMILMVISIHALRKEGDAAWRATRPNSEVFLSTPSARRATPNVNENSTAFWHFYPRPPQGGRPPSNMSMLLANKFLSTPSARRATRYGGRGCPYPRYFYPRPPRGGRQRTTVDSSRPSKFLSTPSARRATQHFVVLQAGSYISIHALREEGDTADFHNL